MNVRNGGDGNGVVVMAKVSAWKSARGGQYADAELKANDAGAQTARCDRHVGGSELPEGAWFRCRIERQGTRWRIVEVLGAAGAAAEVRPAAAVESGIVVMAKVNAWKSARGGQYADAELKANDAGAQTARCDRHVGGSELPEGAWFRCRIERQGTRWRIVEVLGAAGAAAEVRPAAAVESGVVVMAKVSAWKSARDGQYADAELKANDAGAQTARCDRHVGGSELPEGAWFRCRIEQRGSGWRIVEFLGAADGLEEGVLTILQVRPEFRGKLRCGDEQHEVKLKLKVLSRKRLAVAEGAKLAVRFTRTEDGPVVEDILSPTHGELLAVEAGGDGAAEVYLQPVFWNGREHWGVAAFWDPERRVGLRVNVRSAHLGKLDLKSIGAGEEGVCLGQEDLKEVLEKLEASRERGQRLLSATVLSAELKWLADRGLWELRELTGPVGDAPGAFEEDERRDWVKAEVTGFWHPEPKAGSGDSPEARVYVKATVDGQEVETSVKLRGAGLSVVGWLEKGSPCAVSLSRNGDQWSGVCLHRASPRGFTGDV